MLRIANNHLGFRSSPRSTKRSPYRGSGLVHCLIPVDHFYEPNYETGKAVRWRIHRKDGKPFALAGIWEICLPK